MSSYWYKKGIYLLKIVVKYVFNSVIETTQDTLKKQTCLASNTQEQL